jgi:peptidoglycan hydrolase-like protein with peptidoglycan-binding domain
MCLSSTGARGAAPDVSFKQKDKGEAIGFIQERLKSLGCYLADDLSRLTDNEFDAPTANAVIRFQQANDLLAAERDLPHEGEVRREPEFRKLANPWSDLKKCPP